MCEGQEDDMVRSVVKKDGSETPWRRAWRNHQLEYWIMAGRQHGL